MLHLLQLEHYENARLFVWLRRRGEVADPAQSAVQDQWWTLYGDATLDDLVGASLKKNPDVEFAIARIEETNAQLREANAAFLPEIDAGLNGSRSRVSAATAFPNPPPLVRNDVRLQLSTAFEIDFWGRLRRGHEAARAVALGTRYSREVVFLTLEGLVAQTYFTLRSLDTQIDLSQRTLDARRESLDVVGARVRGKVVSLTDYGAFVELEEGVEGLIHVSEMSWTKRVKNPSKLLNVGDTIEAVIADVNPETRRLSLSLRATEPNPWEQLAEKYRIGDRIQGTVRNLTDFGAFVEIEEGIDGLIHVSDMSWGRRVKHPSEVLKKGDEVQAVLTAIDVENRRISLSIKEFRPNEWEEFSTKHQPGDVVDGTVAKVAEFGVFVRLPEGLEGLMHVSETPLARGEKPASHYTEGDPVRVRILRIEPQEQRIGLSSRDVEQPARDVAHAAEAEAPVERASAAADASETHEKAVPAGTDPLE